MDDENMLTNEAQQSKECFEACENEKAKKLYMKKYTAAFILPLVLLVLVFLALQYIYLDTYSDAALWGQGLYFGFTLYHIVILIKNRKVWKELFERAAFSDSEIKVYDGYFTLTTVRDGIEIAFHRFLFSEIRAVSISGDLISVTARGQIFFLDKSKLPENSEFAEILFEDSKKTSTFKPKDKKSILFLIPSVIILLFTLTAVILNNISSTQHLLSSVPNIGLVFLILPFIPIILGIIFRKNKFVFIFSSIAGLITALLVVIFGMNTIGIKVNKPEYDDSFVTETEEVFDIDFPETEVFYSVDYTDDPEAIENGSDLRYASLYYENGELNDFVTDERFLDRLPTVLAGITERYYEGCSVLLYNKDTGEYNTLPEKEGRYRFICIVIDREYGKIEFSDYYVNIIY